MTVEKSDIRLVYFADPMCSWCWGFSPVINQISQHYRDKILLQLIMGGLSPENSQPMTEQSKQEIRQHWQHVRKVSGQTFNFDFFKRESFAYDTEPACRAVISCFRIQPHLILEFLNQLQSAFYVNNQDITDEGQLISVANNLGMNIELFRATLNDQETHRITQLNFQYTRHCQVTGFPTLFAQTPETNTVLSRVYQSMEWITERIDHWFQGQSV